MPDAAPGTVRLTLPADGDLRPVVEVAVAILARRLALPERDVASGRSAVGSAFTELADGTDADVELELKAVSGKLIARLRRGEVARQVTLPEG